MGGAKSVVEELTNKMRASVYNTFVNAGIYKKKREGKTKSGYKNVLIR